MAMMTGKVNLRGLRCEGRHGDPEGGEAAPVFLVDVSIEVDLTAVAVSDSYADVVDLAALAATVRDVVSGPARLLIETVAVHAAQRVLQDYASVRRVQLRLARPDPPGLDAVEEAVEVALDRGTLLEK
jgi:7,8-dihydroneopterin aldolase/epimerase/oxygenase